MCQQKFKTNAGDACEEIKKDKVKPISHLEIASRVSAIESSAIIRYEPAGT
jgi:hypothetical protein